MKKNPARVNIGALSQATKIPTETLRTWERRYNFPTPQRLPSGHRRYDAALIPHLRAIKTAIDQGYRPSAVLQIPYSELLGLLGEPLGSCGGSLDARGGDSGRGGLPAGRMTASLAAVTAPLAAEATALTFSAKS